MDHAASLVGLGTGWHKICITSSPNGTFLPQKLEKYLESMVKK